MEVKLNIRSNFIKKLLKLLVLIVFLVPLKNVVAGEYDYSTFDFKKFAEANTNYWIASCQQLEDDKEKCEDEIIAKQEKFYTKLYELLAKKQKKGYYIDDIAIIAAAFFEYDPASFNDASGAYNLDDADNDEMDFTQDEAEYLEAAEGSLKLLVNAMIGYERVCYGVEEPIKMEQDETEDDNNGFTCKDGGDLREIKGYDNKMCLYKFDDSVTSATLWDKYRDSGVLSFFGLATEEKKDCPELAKNNGYIDGYQEVSENEKVVIEGFWNFLEESSYFDKKDILQHYYASVLEKTGHYHMQALSAAEKKEHEEEIKEIRKEIANNVKSLYESYREDRPMADYMSASEGPGYWWPIGSKETTTEGGKTFASGDPTSTDITSNYGNRVHPITGVTKFHSGVDLVGTNSSYGVENIIASKDGVVSIVQNSSSCTSTNGDNSSTCDGNGYGNFVMIEHSDGNYTMYAHLHPDTITVKQGESVKQGQVIGKMGSSGSSNGTHLHFEVRTDVSNTDDPLNYINPDNPRPRESQGSSGDLVKMIVMFEGSPKVGNAYKVYCNPSDIPTVGPGVTLKYNAQYFAQNGYPLSTSNDYYNYCGSTMPIDIVDKVFDCEISYCRDSIKSTLSRNGISLKNYQIDALISLQYNCGNINGFVDAYKQYGDSSSLCDNWWYWKASGGTYGSVLKRRRTQECKLFTTGVYPTSY